MNQNRLLAIQIQTLGPRIEIFDIVCKTTSRKS